VTSRVSLLLAKPSFTEVYIKLDPLLLAVSLI
jgi:hypothetical protein